MAEDTEGWAGTCVVKLDREDWELLEQTARTEKLPKTEILRRGLRKYAQALDAQEPQEPQPAAAGA
jgi:hypothetical protein